MKDYDICSEPGCYNVCLRGYTLCVGHMYGFPQRASEEAIKWKKTKEGLKMEKHTREWHIKSLWAEWDLIKKYDEDTPESERSKEDFLRWKKRINDESNI